MPEDNEKVDDFVSLWRNKMKNGKSKPSAIGATLEKIKEVEKENENLRNKIRENIELISKTEEIVKKTIEENERLNEEIKQAGMIGGAKATEIKKENMELNNKFQNLNQNLTLKEEELKVAHNVINELKLKIENLSTIEESSLKTVSETNSEVTSALIGDLQSDISKKKTKIADLEKNLMDLIEDNENLKGEIKKLSIKDRTPAEAPKSSVIKPLPIQTSPNTLEILCQDLQSDLNKYKRIVETLTKEKSELQRNTDGSGLQLEVEELKELKKENEELKIHLSQIQESLKKKTEEERSTVPVDDFKEKIKELQNQLKERDHLIAELKLTTQTPVSVQRGPMSSLIEDLQSKINKLKIAIEEKNKIIEEFKSS